MRIFILQFTIMILSYSYSYAQSVISDPIFAPTFIENFSTTTINSTEWASHYPWGTATNTNNNADNGSGSCDGNPWDLACLQMNLTANHNIIANGNTCELIGLKENVMGEVWTFPSPCNSPACAGAYCFDPANPSTSACFKPVQLPFKYSNGMLFSNKKYLYGYFEIKFKLNGLSPNNLYNPYTPTFWLYSADYNQNVSHSEIDVFEISAKYQRFTNNIFLKDAAGNSIIPGGTSVQDLGPNSINLSQWNTAAINWTPEYVDYYLNNTLLRRFNIPTTSPNLVAMPLIIENSFPALNFCEPIDSINTPFPITYEIDYVKVYQPKQACDTNKVYCNATTASFDSKLYASLTIGGTGCYSMLNNGIAHAAGANYVLLNPGFEVGNNMEMLFDTPPCYSPTVQQRTAQELLMPIPTNFIQNRNSRLKQN